MLFVFIAIYASYRYTLMPAAVWAAALALQYAFLPLRLFSRIAASDGFVYATPPALLLL